MGPRTDAQLCKQLREREDDKETAEKVREEEKDRLVSSLHLLLPDSQESLTCPTTPTSPGEIMCFQDIQGKGVQNNTEAMFNWGQTLSFLSCP